MVYPPLKRHSALQPLSREHYTGLTLAQRLLKAARGDAADRRRAVDEFLAGWEAEISVHFSDEESLLPDLIPDPDQHRRLLDEHERIRAMVKKAASLREDEVIEPELLGELGQLLNDHIRWEERVLFPAIEQAASAEQLARLENETKVLQASRPRSACQKDSGAR